MSVYQNQKYINEILKNFQQGDEKNSILKLENYIKDNPSDSKARYNLAVMYQKINQIKKSIEEYYKVIKIDKNNWQALLNLGLIHLGHKLHNKSNHFLRLVLKIKKNYQPALRDIGTNYLGLRDYSAAENILSKALELNSVDYINLNSLALCKMYLHKYDEAKKLFQRAININNKYYVSYNNLGLCFEKTDEIEMAYKYYLKCLKVNPNYPNALNNIGMLYFYNEENIKAFKCFERALKIDPNLVDLYFNIALSYFHMRKFEKAEKFFRTGFKKDPNNFNGNYNYAFMLLALQKYKQAWQQFDYRLLKNEWVRENIFSKKLEHKKWKNQKLDGKKILVLREQGAGDEILYSSMYGDLINLGLNTIIGVDPRLLTLFKKSFKSQKCFVAQNKISKNKKIIKDTDLIIFAGSLGKIFRQKKEDFIKQNKYLFPNKEKTEQIKNRLIKINTKPKIGISWVSKNKKFGKGKSMNLDSLLPILKNTEVSFVNLQYGDYSKEIKNFRYNTDIDIIDFNDIDKFDDFEGLASLLESIDLFITVSNTTAHLSGAIGKETWVMAPKSESLLFYWNTGKKTTPWYPSIRIYQKKTLWENTIKKINMDLLKWIKKFPKN